MTDTDDASPARTPQSGTPVTRPEALDALVAPSIALFSDTMAPADPAVIEALGSANSGGALPYGGDELTGRLADVVRDEIGDPTANVWPCWTGTGANMLATGLLSGHPATGERASGTGPVTIVCSDQAHVLRDEAGGPQQIAHAQDPLTVAVRGGLIPPDALDSALAGLGGPVGPRILWLSQTTEDGRVQELDAMATLIEIGHRHGCSVAIDGARIAHAVAAGAHSLAQVWAAGPDAVVLGGSKVGMIGAELVLSRPGADAQWWRRSGQLPAKSRFVAAQWLALFPGRWLELAGNANARASELADMLTSLGLAPALPVEANTVFVDLGSPEAVAALNTWMPMIAWDGAGLIRLACNPFTTSQDVETVAAAVAAVG